MDGTIIDSEPYWMVAEHELVAQFGGTWSEQQAYALVGSGLLNSAKMLQNAGVVMSAEDIVSWLSERVLEQINQRIPWLPGVRELMSELVAGGVPCALVTMSVRSNAEAVARAVHTEVGGEVFSVIVSANDVEHPKPNPEAYLLAASQLGVDIRHCIALEDSSFGAASAFSAGALTIGLPLHVEIPSHSRTLEWPSLEGKGLSDLLAVYATHREGLGR